MEVTKGRQFFWVRYWFRLNDRTALAAVSAVSGDITTCPQASTEASEKHWECLGLWFYNFASKT